MIGFRKTIGFHRVTGLMALLIGVGLPWPAPAFERGAVASVGRISVETDPPGAAVYLDGQPCGAAPLSLDAPAGEHRVRIVKDGYLENSRVLSVRPGGTQSVQVKMTPDAGGARFADTGEEGFFQRNRKKILIGAAAAGALGVILLASGSGEPENTAPTAGTVNASPSGVGLAAVTVFTFTVQGANDPEGAPLTYSWSFGDGSTGTGESVTHIFGAAGKFQPTVTVSDGTLTATSTLSKAVEVKDVNATWVNITGQPGNPDGITRRVRFEQKGIALTGTYRTTLEPGNTGTVTGAITPPRKVSFTAKLLDVGFTFSGEFDANFTKMEGIANGYLLNNKPLVFGREQ